MAKKEIAIEINIVGSQKTVTTIDGIKDAIKEVNTALKDTKNSSEYDALEGELIRLKAALKDAQTEQRKLVKEAQATKFAEGSYKQLSFQLGKLKDQYKDLSAAERESAKGKALLAKINELDGSLKKIDASAGVFSRNVGNYPRLFNQVAQGLEATIPGFQNFSKILVNSSGQMNIFGKALVGGFAAFKAAKFIGQAIKQLDEFVSKIKETRQSVEGFSGAGGENLDALTATTTALAETFDVNAEEIAKSARTLADATGTSFESALRTIEKGLVAGQASNEEFLQSIEQAPEQFKNAEFAAGEYAKSNQDLLNVNKELAASQIASAKDLETVNNTIKQVSSVIKTVFFSALAGIINFFKPIVAVAQEYTKSIGDLVNSLFGFSNGTKAASQASKAFSNIIGGLQATIIGAVKVSKFLIDTISSLVGLLQGDATKAWQTFTKEGAQAARVQEQVTQATEDVTAAYQDEVAGLNDLFGQLANTNEGSQERKDLIEQLNEQYGEYLPNIDLEVAGQEDLQRAYEETTKAIARSLIERKKVQLQEEAAGKIIEAQTAQILAQKEAARIAEELATSQNKVGEAFATTASAISAGGTELLGFESKTNSLRKALVEANNEAKKQDQILSDAQKTIEALSEATEGVSARLSGLYNIEDLKKNAAEANSTVKKSTKEQIADEKKRGEDLAKLRAKQLEEYKKNLKAFNDSEIKLAEQRSSLLLSLQARFAKELTANIADERTRRLEELRLDFEKEKAQLNTQLEDLKKEAAKREKELAEQFGAASSQVLQARKNAAIAIADVEAEQAKIRIEIEKAYLEDVADVEQQFEDERIKRLEQQAAELAKVRNNQLGEELAYIDELAEMRSLKNEENLNRILAQESSAAEQRKQQAIAAEQAVADEIEKILNKLQAVKDQEDFLKLEIEAGVKIDQSEFDEVFAARQKLNTQLSALELKQTQTVAKNSQDRQDSRKKEIEQAVAGFSEGLDLFNQFLGALSDKEVERQQARIDENQKQIDSLQERLQDATGLERRFLKQQIKDRAQAAEQLAAEQEAIQKKAAAREKAIAIAQSLVRTALSVGQALASPPGVPFTIPQAILAGVLGAAQTAMIAAQPLAEGGAVIPVELPDSGGRVINAQNIPATAKGDKVLAALTPGETVLTRANSLKLAPFLKALRVPGFATGGTIGGVATSPNLSTVTTVSTDAIRAFDERTRALEGVIVNQKVILVTDELDQDTEDKNRITKRTKLGG